MCDSAAAVRALARPVQDTFPRRIQPAESVEQVQLIRRLQQRFALALAVNVHQQFADLFERGDGDWLVVDIGVTAAGARQPRATG